VRYDRMADRPGWYNRVPIAYIQRIVVKSVISIPPPRHKESSSDDPDYSDKLYLIDAFRTPLTHLFELNQFIRNFQTKQHTLAGDLCVHVGELSKNENIPFPRRAENSDKSAEEVKAKNEFNKHYLPEFNCLYLSPANFWLNDAELFAKDEDLMNTINELVSLQKKPVSSSSTSQSSSSSSSNEHNISSLFVKLLSSLTSDYLSKTGGFDSERVMQTRPTSIRDLLFGVSWSSVFKSLQDDPLLVKKLNETGRMVGF
jgi:hypothetical protein